LEDDGILKYKGKVYVPDTHEMINIVLREIHNVPYARHPGYHKTIVVVRSWYFWLGMKKDVAGYISKCMECHKVKEKNIHLDGLLQPLAILECK
jgi:hypothetical protein